MWKWIKKLGHGVKEWPSEMPYKNVVFLNGVEMPVERVQWGIKQKKLKTLTAIGRDENGGLHLLSSLAKGKDILWDMEQIKATVLDLEE